MFQLEDVDFQASAQSASSTETGEESESVVRGEAAGAAEATETSQAHRTGEACRQTTERVCIAALLSDSAIASLFSQVETKPTASKAFPKPGLRSLPKPVIPRKAKTPVGCVFKITSTLGTSQHDLTNFLWFCFNRGIKRWLLRTTSSFRTSCSPDRYRSNQDKVLK